MAAKLQCEICGGKLIGKPGGIFECDSCGMEYSTAWAKEKIQEITGTVKVEGTVEVTGKVQVVGGTVQVDSSASKEALLRRGELALEDRNWNKAKKLFDQVLNIEAECSEAYLGLAMAEAQSQDREAFRQSYIEAHSELRLKGNSYIARARQFSKELNKWFLSLDEEGVVADTAARLTAERANNENILRLSLIREKIARPMNMIAAGYSHTVGVRADGSVVAVGLGQHSVSGWTDIVAVAEGTLHTVGLRGDGSVVAVGNNDDGQCNVSTWMSIVAIAAGKNHTVGLRADGSVVAVGLNIDGQCNITGWTDIVAIAAGAWHTVGLRRDGSVVAVGDNGDDECEVSNWANIASVAAGWRHTVGLREDGSVVAVGNNDDGQCEVTAWTNVVAITANESHTVGLRADGSVVAVGYNNHGQCGVSGWANVVAVAAGNYYTVGLRADGSVVAVGGNDYGQSKVTDWKLFNSFETIEAERKDAKEKVETERKQRIEKLKTEKSNLQMEIANLRGLFTGRRCRELQDRIDAIEEELERLK